MDTGIRESITGTLLPYLDAAGIPRERVRWAINTHCDDDHTGGNGALRQAIPSAEILAHELDAELVEDVDRLIAVRYGEFRATDGFDDPPETTEYLRSVSDLVPVDRRLVGGEEFDLGGRAVRVLHAPGHSPGHVAVHDPANRALVIGDATLGTTVPFADGRAAFPPTYRHVDPYVATLDAFRELDVDLLLTAHYPVYSGAAVRGFLDESEAPLRPKRPSGRSSSSCDATTSPRSCERSAWCPIRSPRRCTAREPRPRRSPHGGPWPATNSQHTSVGVSAIRRFLRPLAFQDAPEELLPRELRDGYGGIPRRIDGVLQLG